MPQAICLPVDFPHRLPIWLGILQIKVPNTTTLPFPFTNYLYYMYYFFFFYQFFEFYKSEYLLALGILSTPFEGGLCPISRHQPCFQSR